MYRRYSDVNRGSVSVSQVRRNRIKNIVIVLLTAALIAVLAVSIPVMQNQNGSRNLYIQRMQTEMGEAIRQTTTLSRNAGADSAAILARIRSYIYGIRLMNELAAAQSGMSENLLDENMLSAIQSSIDNYLAKLTTGMDTGEYQTNLQNDTTELMTMIQNLQ